MGHPRLAVILTLAIAATAGAAPAAQADGRDRGSRPPDAEMFATSNRALVTDPGDPRLEQRLTAFGRTVRRLIAQGGGSPAARPSSTGLLLLPPRHDDLRALP